MLPVFLCSLIVRAVFPRMTGDSESFNVLGICTKIKFDQSFFEVSGKIPIVDILGVQYFDSCLVRMHLSLHKTLELFDKTSSLSPGST